VHADEGGELIPAARRERRCRLGLPLDLS